MKLAIADPPYPPFNGVGGLKPRASRWYGDKQLAANDRPADVHPEAAIWDDPATHRRLLLDLCAQFDGWAIATSPDGLAAYGQLPTECRIMAWLKPNSQPGAHRLQSCWEPVILFPPAGRRSSRGGQGMVPDALIAARPTTDTFIGEKPAAWTRWVLDALTFNPDTDTLTDVFAGSGAVARAAAQSSLPLEGVNG